MPREQARSLDAKRNVFLADAKRNCEGSEGCVAVAELVEEPTVWNDARRTDVVCLVLRVRIVRADPPSVAVEFEAHARVSPNYVHDFFHQTRALSRLRMSMVHENEFFTCRGTTDANGAPIVAPSAEKIRSNIIWEMVDLISFDDARRQLLKDGVRIN
jgi:hypothetical protein